MANQSENTPTATDVGKNFINQYRQIFRGDSKVLHKFYQDSSVLSRPEQDGSMKSVTTMEVSLVKSFNSFFTDVRYLVVTAF